jgi:hypothetical protein
VIELGCAVQYSRMALPGFRSNLVHEFKIVDVSNDAFF